MNTKICLLRFMSVVVTKESVDVVFCTALVT